MPERHVTAVPHATGVRDWPFAERSPARLAAFQWYLHFLFWRRFSAVRVARSGLPAPFQGRPLVIYTNHPSWWDPALFILVTPKLFPGRIGFGPMDAAQLQAAGIGEELIRLSTGIEAAADIIDDFAQALRASQKG